MEIFDHVPREHGPALSVGSEDPFTDGVLNGREPGWEGGGSAAGVLGIDDDERQRGHPHRLEPAMPEIRQDAHNVNDDRRAGHAEGSPRTHFGDPRGPASRICMSGQMTADLPTASSLRGRSWIGTRCAGITPGSLSRHPHPGRGCSPAGSRPRGRAPIAPAPPPPDTSRGSPAADPRARLRALDRPRRALAAQHPRGLRGRAERDVLRGRRQVTGSPNT